MADVTDVPDAAVGDTVTVFGHDGDDFIPVTALSDPLGTISYEIVCGINKRVPRLYMRGSETVETQQYIV
jgi:alanine racemase